MESQLNPTHNRHHAGADLHEEDKHGVEKQSAIKKVKATIKHIGIGHDHDHDHDDGHHKDAENIMNESPAVRSGLMQPTDMGKAVLAEDLYATHSDILDTPVRSFAQWEKEERHGAPPPLPTGIYGTGLSQVGHHGFGQDVNKEQLRGSIGKSSGMEEHPSARNPATAVSPANRQTEVPAPTTNTDLSQVGHHGFNQDANRKQFRGGIGKSTGMEEDPRAPNPTTAVSQANRQTEVPAPTNTDPSHVRHRGFDPDLNREQFKGGIGKSTGMVQDPSAPNLTTAYSPANHQTKVTDPTKTGGKEAGITDVLRSFNKMGVYDEPHSKSSESHQNQPKVYTGSHDHIKSSESDQNEPKAYTGSDDHSKSSESHQNEPKVYTGSHDQFAPEPVEKTTSASAPSDSDSDKAAVAKDVMVSNENKREAKSSSNYAHKVADKVSGTLGPVYETMVGVGSSVMSKLQGSETPATTRITEKKEGSIKDYLVETLRPADEDKVVSDVITNAFHRNPPHEEVTSTTSAFHRNPPHEEVTSTTSIYVRDEGGEGRLQDYAN